MKIAKTFSVCKSDPDTEVKYYSILTTLVIYLPSLFPLCRKIRKSFFLRVAYQRLHIGLLFFRYERHKEDIWKAKDFLH